MILRGLVSSALGLVLLTASLPALAQEQLWLQDRRFTEGMGYRVGDLELHPGAAAEFGYDTNYFLRAEGERPVDSLRFRLTPSLSISTLGPERREASGPSEPPTIDFRAGLAATFNEFIATDPAQREWLSEQRNIGGVGSARLKILPERPWSGDVYGNLSRLVQPSQNPDRNYDRLESRLGAGLSFRPGGGIFDWRIGYEFGLTAFSQTTFEIYDNTQHQINTRGRWRFLPRTALLYDASIGFIRYDDAEPLQHSSNPVRARLGVNGLVTRSVALLAMAGWGSSFYEGEDAQQFDSVIGQAELKWFISVSPSADLQPDSAALSSLAVGYKRDFANSYLGDYYSIDRGYLNLTYFAGRRFLTALEGGASALGYPTLFFPEGGVRSTPFTNIRVDATAFGEYRVSNSLGINTTIRYSGEISKKSLLVQPPPPVMLDDLSFRRIEAYLGVRWFM